VGANIGAGLMLLIGPWLIVALLVLAVWLAFAGGRWSLRRAWLFTLASVLVAPALYAGLAALDAYDVSAGLITARQYADVRIGQSRSAVHERLGREIPKDEAFDFPSVPGLLCEFYYEVNTGAQSCLHLYQFCFRRGVPVRKNQN